MNNPIDKLQFDRLAAIIDDSFGIADDTGTVFRAGQAMGRWMSSLARECG